MTVYTRMWVSVSECRLKEMAVRRMEPTNRNFGQIVGACLFAKLSPLTQNTETKPLRYRNRLMSGNVFGVREIHGHEMNVYKAERRDEKMKGEEGSDMSLK